MRFYSLALMSIQISFSPAFHINVGLEAFALFAVSKEEAGRVAMEKTLEYWPINENWTRHNAVVMPVTFQRDWTIETEKQQEIVM